MATRLLRRRAGCSMPDQTYTWSRESQRFRSLETGRYVSERDIRDLVDKVADLASRRMGDAAARFRAGQIDVGTWIAESQAIIKDSQIAAALLAYGGRAQMGPSEWGRVGQQIKTQYAYLNRMAADVLDGKQRMNGRLDARARQYGQAARSLYENTRRQQSAQAGLSFERNVRHSSEGCAGCVAASNAGWVPIGTLPPIGSRSPCRQGCRCTLAYSRSMSEAA